MRSAVLERTPGKLVASDISLTETGFDEVLVRTVACGLCPSDLHIAHGTVPLPLPALLGHEAAGVVEQVGDGVSDIQKGDHVVVHPSAPCGQCGRCSAGISCLCEQQAELQRRPGGTLRLHRDGEGIYQMGGIGAFAEKILTHRSNLTKVPNELPLDLGAILGCTVMTGVGAVMNSAQVRIGSTVAVIGCGAIGLNVVQGARLAGAQKIIAIDLDAERLAMADDFGATSLVDSALDDPVEVVNGLTNGGADCVFEAVGSAETAGQAFRMTRPGSTSYLVGLPTSDTDYGFTSDALVAMGRGIQGVIMGTDNYDRDIPILANLYLQGRLKLNELVTHHYSLDQINLGLEGMEGGRTGRSVVMF